jgi:chemotaxis protein methyltransferase CheR
MQGIEVTQNLIYGLGQTKILSDAEFTLFRDMIYAECGVNLGLDKKLFLESRMKKRMEELGIKSGQEYYSLVTNVRTKFHELPTLLDALMICETSFFRNQAQFDLFKQVVLPEIVAKKERTGSRMLRVWSAGCSTGQEPYTAALTLLETLRDAENWTLRVFASDLSYTALERAQNGLYRQDQMKGIGPFLMAKYFREENGGYQINEAVKKCVTFDYHNLKNDNGLRNLDAIFCRNVMIYFDREEQGRLVNRFANCLVPGGYLFIGHAESLQGLSNRFSMIHQNKGIAYRLNE